MYIKGVFAIIKQYNLIFILTISLLAGICNTGYAQCSGTNTPIAAFSVTYNNTSCLLSTVDFKDISTLNGFPITSWSWDFGDAQTSNIKNPSHTYTTPGDYYARLTVTNSIGCSSTSPAQKVTIISKLAPDFDASASTCPNPLVTFADKSTSVDPIAEWRWTFGDSTAAVTRTTNAPFTHTYTTTGDYNVSLEIISTSGCVSDIRTKTIKVVAVNFNICPGDIITQFTDITAKTGNTGLLYNWDFGDAASTIANPNTSTDQNPVHHYINPGTYTATLTVQSQNGCAPATKSKSFTITGTPIAKFDIENKTNLCSSDSVTFIDETSVNSNITKLVWYYDIDNHPTDSVVYNKANMHSDKKYRYFYGLNNTTTPQTYRALLVAYTGGPCANSTFQQNVILNPNPVVTLKVNNSLIVGPVVLCQGDDVINIISSANIPGKPTFTGTGISSDGAFDPKISGPGTFTINYLYTADNTGCTYTKIFKIIVMPGPVITMASTADILDGGRATLNPKVTGNGLTYAWLPTTGVSDTTLLNPFFNPTQDTKYTLTVKSDKGCNATAQITVHVLKTPVVPNAFTPNNDGINDTWDIKYLNIYPKATVEVFNRFGTKVYSSIGYTIPWDGKFNGANLPFGVYYYVINPKPGLALITGSLTIIK